VVLKVDGLRKRYGDNEVVRGLSFTINRGDCFGLSARTARARPRRCAAASAHRSGRRQHHDGRAAGAQGTGREARIRVGVVPQMDNLDPGLHRSARTS
jgi:lipooligosaccharide transport system ATP-binding protein